MSTPGSVAEVLELYERRGAEHYGEDVSQLAHALQCAALASASHAADELVAAALLHDIGHLVVDHPGSTLDGAAPDDHHEAVGARILAGLFGAAVAAPVALHVTAKRWRSAVDPDYRSTLSAASILSLAAQGGPLSDDARTRFEAHPASANAVALRAWDDAAKDPAAATPSLRDYEVLLTALARTAART